MPQYYVYMLASRSRTLYVGVTNDLARRLHEHREGLVPGFTTTYRINRLVFFETTNDVRSAISREKQLKGGKRERKLALVADMNPTWRDLSEDWS